MNLSHNRAIVRLGIIGCGNVRGAYVAVAEDLRREGLAEVTALCGRERQRSTVAQSLPGCAFHLNDSELLERPDVDAVVVLTPMQEHARIAKAALEAGKHVLVEKPMATTLKDARELIELAREKQRLLICAPFTILSPTFKVIARRLKGGDIGRVVSARGRYGWAGPDWTEWFYRPGGGALFDLGVYNLTTLTGWLGPVRRVTAMTGAAIPKREVQGHVVDVQAEDNAQVLLDFGGACFAALTSGFTLQQYRGPGIELYGTEGTINLLGDDWDPDGYELWQNSAGCWQFYKETHPDWPWVDGLRHLVECVRERKHPLVTPEHAFHVLDVMLQAQASGRDGRAREVESAFTPPEFEDTGGTIAAHRVHDRTRSD